MFGCQAVLHGRHHASHLEGHTLASEIVHRHIAEHHPSTVDPVQGGNRSLDAGRGVDTDHHIRVTRRSGRHVVLDVHAGNLGSGSEHGLHEDCDRCPGRRYVRQVQQALGDHLQDGLALLIEAICEIDPRVLLSGRPPTAASYQQATDRQAAR